MRLRSHRQLDPQSALNMAMNLKTLAEELGLSQTTVSRALNGYPEVSEATRKRVQEAAAATTIAPTAVRRVWPPGAPW